MLVAGRGSKDSQLCNALCLRALARISDRHLDRESFETTIFSAEEKNYGTGATRIFGHLFWRKRRLRAAILVSPCAEGFTEIHNGEELRRWAGAPSRRGTRLVRPEGRPSPCKSRIRKGNGPVSQVVSTAGLR